MTPIDTPKPPEEGQRYIYRPYIKKPDGTVIWARTYGKKAFRIPVNDTDTEGSGS